MGVQWSGFDQMGISRPDSQYAHPGGVEYPQGRLAGLGLVLGQDQAS